MDHGAPVESVIVHSLGGTCISAGELLSMYIYIYIFTYVYIYIYTYFRFLTTLRLSRDMAMGKISSV